MKFPMIPPAIINTAKAEGSRIIAVGTTSARTLETAASMIRGSAWQGTSGWTDIFIYPGYTVSRSWTL